MKFTGEKLRAVLMAQWESVRLVAADGTERCGLGARYAVAQIAGAAFTGYGSNGIVLKIVADAMARRGPFATRRDIAAAMTDFPRVPHADKNPQAPVCRRRGRGRFRFLLALRHCVKSFLKSACIRSEAGSQ